MRALLLAGVMTIGLASVAQAAPIAFDLSASLVDGGSINGRLDIDTATGTPQYGSFDVVYDNGKTDSFQQAAVVLGNYFSGSFLFYFNNFGYGDNATTLINLPTTSLVAYEGGSLCSRSVSCSYTSNFYTAGGAYRVDVQAGSLTPVPEPASLALLGLGAAGIITACRRKGQAA